MVTVALAGATSGFGLTMLRVFMHLNQQNPNPHKIVVFSRSARPELSAQGIDVRPVDYSDHSALVSALSGVHTVLSLVGGQPSALLQAQLALIAAAKEAGVKRFAPSEYGGNGYEGVSLYAPKATVWEATQASGMECTRFECGLFMSTLATGTPKPRTAEGEREGVATGEEEALAGLRPWNFVLNVRAGTADLAGDGTAELVLTDTRDVARFVYAALSLPHWAPDMSVRGDVTTYRKLIAILERVQGRKFLVHENSLEKLKKEAEDPGLQFYNEARVALATGWGMIGDELNRAFPDIKPITCEKFIEKWWSGVELGEPAWVENKAYGVDEL